MKIQIDGQEWEIEIQRVQEAMSQVHRMLSYSLNMGLKCDILLTQLGHLKQAILAFQDQDVQAGREHVMHAMGD